jgi:hypothetical protein
MGEVKPAFNASFHQRVMKAAGCYAGASPCGIAEMGNLHLTFSHDFPFIMSLS